MRPLGGKACHQRMILVTHVEMCQEHRARRQRDVILEHHEGGEVHQHLLADKAAPADPQCFESAAVDIDHREAMQNRVDTDRRAAQTKKDRSQRGKRNQPEYRQQDRSPNVPSGATKPNFAKGPHQRALFFTTRLNRRSL